MNIKLHVKCYNEYSYLEHIENLEELDVTECHATYPTDKVMILSKIQEIGEFNKYLRRIIVENEGMFSSWRRESKWERVGEVLGYTMGSLLWVLVCNCFEGEGAPQATFQKH